MVVYKLVSFFCSYISRGKTGVRSSEDREIEFEDLNGKPLMDIDICHLLCRPKFLNNPANKTIKASKIY